MGRMKEEEPHVKYKTRMSDFATCFACLHLIACMFLEIEQAQTDSGCACSHGVAGSFSAQSSNLSHEISLEGSLEAKYQSDQTIVVFP